MGVELWRSELCLRLQYLVPIDKKQDWLIEVLEQHGFCRVSCKFTFSYPDFSLLAKDIRSRMAAPEEEDVDMTTYHDTLPADLRNKFNAARTVDDRK